jgi:hypothetical protein
MRCEDHACRAAPSRRAEIVGAPAGMLVAMGPRMRLSAWIVVPAAATLGLLTLHCSSSDAGAPGDAGAAQDAWRAPDTGTPIDAGDPGQVDIHFEVHADQNVHPISPFVYGVNDGAQAKNAGATLVRNGGNRLTAFNWENNASNAGSDYNYENDDYMCANAKCLPSNDAPGAFLKAVVDQATAAGAQTMLTVPIVDYVSADKSPPGDVRNSGASYLSTRFKQNVAAKGAPFSNPPNTTDGVVYQDEMVAWLKQTAPSATLWFLLDNEPDLWSSTHPEVHKDPVTYAELAKRSVDFAKAIKAVMPSAPVFGPVSYGWNGFVNLQNATDAQANGDFLEWWLAQMAAAEKSAGKRLVDGMDLHWYPEAQGGGQRIIKGGTSAAEITAREQAPRSLWDSTYTETSWITQSSTNGPINLIPRLKAKIAAKYPGTMLSFTEWNYGAGNHISGAIASADVLGIFGRDGVSLATMWPLGDESFTYAAFRSYRDYDGHGKAFGDTSIAATTDDVPDSSIYASIDSANPSRLVVVAINKASSAKVAGIKLFAGAALSRGSVYTLTGGSAALAAGAGLTAVAANAFRISMPAQSVTVIEFAP